MPLMSSLAWYVCCDEKRLCSGLIGAFEAKVSIASLSRHSDHRENVKFESNHSMVNLGQDALSFPLIDDEKDVNDN
jgi:hypothetical protein